MATSVLGVSGPQQCEVKKQAKDVSAKFALEAKPKEVKAPKEGLLQGEIEMTGMGGHRAKYIIAPPDMEDADEILRWMFTNPHGWRLNPPNLLLSCYGGRDHYVNWPQSKTLKNREAWFNEGVPSDDWKFVKRFLGRMGEISGGVCQAVSECGGWFDFGTGGRGGMNELLKDGMKVYWSAKGALAGHKTDCVVLAIRSLDMTEFADVFKVNAIPCGSNADDTVQTKTRVLYPSVDHKIFPEIIATSEPPPCSQDPTNSSPPCSVHEDTSKMDFEVKCEVTRRFLSTVCTHVIFVQNVHIEDKLKEKLRELATRAVIVANGKLALVESGIEGKLVTEAMSGTPVICLHNTGGAAEMLGHAVMKRRNAPMENPHLEYQYTLPEHVPDDQILILNPAKDSVEKVINKLTLVLSTVQDAEMTAVGYIKSEQQRLLYGWEMVTLYEFNATKFKRQARLLFYSCVMLSVVMTFLALCKAELSPYQCFRTQDTLLGEESRDSMLKFYPGVRVLLLLFPVLNTFLLTIINRINPLGKWANLQSGAIMTRSEIYQYRCRVMEYMPRKNAQMDIEEKVEALCDHPPPQQDKLSLQVAEAKKKKKDDAKTTKRSSRRGTFSAELERINSETISSELRSDCLQQPPAGYLEGIYQTLFNSSNIKREEAYRKLGLVARLFHCCCSCCKGRMEREPQKYGYTYVDDAWQAHGTDFLPNAKMIEDEFLKDDGVSLVTAEDYVHFRLLPLIQYFNQRAPFLSRWQHVSQITIYFLTALVSAAAVLEHSEVVPLLIAMAGAVQSMLEFENLSVQLRNVNQSLERLKNLRIWWNSLSMVERRLLSNKEVLVSSTEACVDAEISAWKKSMQPIGRPQARRAVPSKQDEEEPEEKPEV
eukprot:CAMPEP_0179108028 /NCGR_PEP_ID=MMETSP0796-20121207/50301_1 /TAXON_ID=73915 /ORGANISM="Pyrodinium bahamense, Strain pbaha01" /LENGTH=877 /DNA_ID=CAMNT_0020806091 /DNA_START=36 /DNA_END=2669 /DNA_ORIENTATION=+